MQQDVDNVLNNVLMGRFLMMKMEKHILIIKNVLVAEDVLEYVILMLLNQQMMRLLIY